MYCVAVFDEKSSAAPYAEMPCTKMPVLMPSSAAESGWRKRAAERDGPREEVVVVLVRVVREQQRGRVRAVEHEHGGARADVRPDALGRADAPRVRDVPRNNEKNDDGECSVHRALRATRASAVERDERARASDAG